MKKMICLVLLTAVIQALADVRLMWNGATNDVAQGVTNYAVYSWPPATGGFFVLTNTGMFTNIIIQTPTNGTQFYVTAQTPSAESDPSNIVVYDKPLKPTFFRFQTP